MKTLRKKLLDGKRISPTDLKRVCNRKKPRGFTALIEEFSGSFPNSGRLTCLPAHPILITNVCERRGGRCRDFATSETKVAPYDIDLNRAMLLTFKEKGGREIYLTSGYTSQLPVSYYETLIKILVTDLDFEVSGLGAELISYLSVKSFHRPKYILARLYMAGLHAINEDPAILENEIRLRTMNTFVPSDSMIEICRQIYELGSPIQAWLNIGWLETYEHRIRAILNLRKIAEFGRPGKPSLQCVTVSCYHPLDGVRKCNMDLGEFGRTIASVRMLLMDVPCISINTSGFSREHIVTAIKNGVNDLGVVLLPGIPPQSPYFANNVLLPDIHAIANKAGLKLVERTSQFTTPPV